MVSEAQRLSRVIEDIYDAALDPQNWKKALESSCAFIGGSSAVLFWHDAATELSDVAHIYNEDPYYTRLYFEKYAHLNPVFPAATFLEEGVVHTSEDLVPHAEFLETQFYREWCEPQGIVSAIAAVLERTHSTSAFLNIRWLASDGPLDDGPLDRTALLVPHFQRAVGIAQLFDQGKTRQRLLTETLNHLEAGVYLLTPAGRIVFTNNVGQVTLDEGKILRQQDQVLIATDPEADRVLRDIFAASARGDAAVGSAGVSVPLSIIPGDRWFAHVLPLTSGERGPGPSVPGATAALFLRKTSPHNPTPLEALAKQFKLTASELRVLDAVLRVSSVNALAETLGISQSTVKTHLQNLFRKTGAHRQGELVKLVAGFGGQIG